MDTVRSSIMQRPMSRTGSLATHENAADDWAAQDRIAAARREHTRRLEHERLQGLGLLGHDPRKKYNDELRDSFAQQQRIARQHAEELQRQDAKYVHETEVRDQRLKAADDQAAAVRRDSARRLMLENQRLAEEKRAREREQRARESVPIPENSFINWQPSLR